MADITRYEVAAKSPSGKAYLVSYSLRLSRRGLLAAMQGRGDALIELIGITDDDQFSFSTKPRPFAKIKDWWIGFTGRTRRDAENEGELPFVEDIVR